MFALRIASRRAPLAVRSFSTTTVSRADILQSLYIKELKSYKPPKAGEEDHVGSVKEWVPPAVPKSPVEELDVSKDLSTYANAAVEIEGVTVAKEAAVEDWFDVNQA